MESRKSKIIRRVIIALSVAGMVFILIKGYYQCPARTLFGIKCPLCGICRAVLSAFSGNIAEAFRYHPLWPVIVPVFIVEILNGTGLIKIPRKANDIGLCIGAFMLIVCYVVRLLTNTLI